MRVKAGAAAATNSSMLILWRLSCVDYLVRDLAGETQAGRDESGFYIGISLVQAQRWHANTVLRLCVRAAIRHKRFCVRGSPLLDARTRLRIALKTDLSQSTLLLQCVCRRR